MENFFSRHKNPFVLILVLFIQVIALATQVKRPENPRVSGRGGTTLIRVWTIDAITPFERAVVGTGHFFRSTWNNYIDLHNVRKENRELQEEISRLRLEQVRLRDDADQAHRLQAMLDFKQHYIGKTVAAQVIGSSGSEQSHVIYIDKGSSSGVTPDMPVITPDGVVGKTKDVTKFSSQVLMINDRDSGAGVILSSSRLQGVLRGAGQGELQVSDIMSDEKVDVGEQVITSGGDRIYPKGLPVGTISSAVPDAENDPFLKITVRPAANLSRLEEVLVVTSVVDEKPSVAPGSTTRAADILAERLPSVPKPVETNKPAGAPKTSGNPTAPTAAGNTTAVAPGANKNVAGNSTKKGTADSAKPGIVANPAALTGAAAIAKPSPMPAQKKPVADQAKAPAAATPTPKPVQPKKTKPAPSPTPSDNPDQQPSTSEKPPR